jgi:hypothetical protein
LYIVRPNRVAHEIFILLYEEGLECGKLDQPIMMVLPKASFCSPGGLSSQQTSNNDLTRLR